MFSLEPELQTLKNKAFLPEKTADDLIAVERRDVFSIYGELRFLTWAGVMLIVSGVGVLVAKNLDRIGPLAIAAAIGLASAACYGWTIWRRRFDGAGREGVVGDFILLLGALLLSADIGYIEHHWHLLGNVWQRHFLLLAVIHGAGAYAFRSRMVLSLSISALAAFIGIERNLETLFDDSLELAIRAFACAGILFLWRAIDRRLRASVVSFTGTFDHFATNLAFWGALILMANRDTRVVACAIAFTFAIFSAVHGWRANEEMFVIYGWIYGLIAVNVFIVHLFDLEVLAAFLVVVSTIAAIVGLFVIHARMRRAA